MQNGSARAVYVVIATKDGQTEFWAAATPRHRAAAAVQQLLPDTVAAISRVAATVRAKTKAA